MNIRILLVVLAVLASSCGDNGGQRQVMSRNEVSYLEAVVPPCSGNEGSTQQHCATDIPELDTVSIQGAPHFWPMEEGDPPTMTDLLLGTSLITDKYYPSLAPHIVVRGIAKPNSTRCDVYPMFTGWETDLYIGLYHYLCFVDFTVNEYLVGTGPANLTVAMHRENLWYVDMDNWSKQKAERFLEYPQQRTALAFEGREVILFLGNTTTIAVESWEPSGAFSIWYVQKHGDQLRVVSPAKSITTVENKREWLDQPIEEFTQMVKQAGKERIELTGGRIGIGTQYPFLVTDANFFQDYYLAIGAVYDSSDRGTILPPPAPGEGDPAAPTIPDNEGTTDTTLPVPGEETSVPPSTDDAGLEIGQETTTTSSTTTVAEAPATSDATPTVTTTAVTAEEPVATAPDATPTATGTTTTTTVVETGSNGEDVAPSADDDSSGGESVASTSTTSTLAQTTVVVALSGDDDGSVGASVTTVPSDGVAPPVDNGGPEEEQQDTGHPVDDG